MEPSKTCAHCGTAVAEDRVRREFQGFCPGCLAREAGLELPAPERRGSAPRRLALLALLAAAIAAGILVFRPAPPGETPTALKAEPTSLPTKEAGTLRGHQGQVVHVSFSPTGELLASSGIDGAVRIWGVSTGLLQRSLAGREGGGLAWSPQGDLAVSAGPGDRRIRFWNAVTGEQVRVMDPPTNESADCLSFHPRQNLLACSSGRDGTGQVHLRDFATGAILRSLPGHEKPLLRIAFSPDGRHLVSGEREGYVRMSEVESGREVWSLRPGCPSAGESVRFSSDGRWVASEREDSVLALWEASTGELVRVFEGHGKHIHDVAFSPDGSWIASGSGDMTIRIWSTATGRCLRVLEGHSGWVRSMDVSKDGRRLASGSTDGTVRLWEIPPSK